MKLKFDRPRPGETDTCESILRSLQEWFEIEEAITSYRRDIETMETYVARANTGIVGFVTVQQHNDQSAELHVMAVRKELHRTGIGRALVSHVEAELRKRQVRLFQVKTLGPSRRSNSYEKTRLFYEALGFISLEETTAIWGASNPCLIMVKHL